LGVEYIELRNTHPEQATVPPNVDRYATFTKRVSQTEEGLFDKLPKKTRNMVRRALKTPFAMRIEKENIENFERLHSETMRRVGTPCFPKEHFREILQNFKGMVDNPSVAMVPKTVTFAPGTSGISVVVIGKTPGSTLIHASALPYIAETIAIVAGH
jgi:hypothetical protein